MVAFLPALLVGMSSLWVAVHLLKPKLPTYRFQIQKMAPKIINRTFKAKLGADVQMENHNYVHIDIHALSFDLFYPDRTGSLNHIGHVHDKEQGKQQQQQQNDVPTQQVDKVKTTFAPGKLATTANDEQEEEMPSPPLWALSPRQLFETTDEVMLQPAGNWRVLSSLAYDMWKHWGTLQVPSSGVIHLKVAKSRVPVTLSILCDNVLDAWSMEMQGIDCELHAMELGWLDLSQAVEKLRNVVVKTTNKNTEDDANKRRPATTTNISSLLAGTSNNNNNNKGLSSAFEEEYDKLMEEQKRTTVDWKQAMPMLAM